MVSYLILSGEDRSLSYDKTHAMREMLVDLGVPLHALIEDSAGLSTFDSIQRAGRIAAGRRLIIVTQDLYCPRAVLIARGLGVDALACPLPFRPAEAAVLQEEKACVRALLDLMGLRSLTQHVEQHGGICMGQWA